MKWKQLMKILIIGSTFGWTSCSTVKPYQKQFLNDPDMALEMRKLDFFETNFQTYREGASGANGGKVGGGCGCN